MHGHGQGIGRFRHPAIADYVEARLTARLVPHGDLSGLRAALGELLSGQGQRGSAGRRGRSVIDGGRNRDGFVSAPAEIAHDVMRVLRNSGGKAGAV